MFRPPLYERQYIDFPMVLHRGAKGDPYTIATYVRFSEKMDENGELTEVSLGSFNFDAEFGEPIPEFLNRVRSFANSVANEDRS